MSTTIDKKVVEMQFDNRRFEENVRTSLSTLDKLKRALHLDGAAKGLEEVNAAARNSSLPGLGSAVETVRAKFSAFEVVAMTALANITNSVINTGKQMLHSLTVEPISQGFEEYELKMGSVQTIMASSGASLEEVNGYLNELNTYADKTIYSFADMTSNIGKFTNAGVKLEDAVMAIQGISNEAAVSGANANEASHAMYNFAQALSAGSVKLIDWKSIELANMATVEFKNELLKSAEAAGTVKKTADGMYRVLSTNAKGDTMDETIDATKMFNESLSYQWMTTEVLVSTLKQYADETTDIGKKAFAAAQDVKTFSQLMDTLKEAVGSGWAMTWEILFGDFEEAKKLWTNISDVVGGFIDAQSDARNAMLQGWKDLGGRTVLIDSVKFAFDGLVSVVKPIKEAFREIFPAMTSERLFQLTEGLKNFTAKLKLSETTSANLKNTCKGLFALLDIVKQAFSALLKPIGSLFNGISGLGGGILGVTGSWGEWLVKLDESVKKSDIFNKSIQRVIDFVKKASDIVKEFSRDLKDRFNIPDLETIKKSLKDFLGLLKEKINMPGWDAVCGILERIQKRMSQAGKAADVMKDGVGTAVEAMGKALEDCNFLQILEKLWNGFKTIAGGIVKAAGELAGGLSKKLGGADFNGILDILNGLAFGGIAVGIHKFVSGLTDSLESIDGVLKHVTDIFDGVRGCFEAYQTQLKAGTLLKIASAIGILTAAIVVVSLIDSDRLSASIGAITMLFADLMGSMAIFNKISGSIGKTGKACAAMISMSVAVLILAGAMQKLAKLDWEEIAKGLISIAGLTTILVASAKIMSSGSGKLIKGAGSLVIFAAAIKILASVCKDLASLSWSKIGKGLTAVGGLMAEISIFLNTAKFGKKAISTATGIVILSSAMKILASVCEDFGSMPWSEIGKGLTAIGGLLTEITLFTKLTGKAEHVVSTGAALVLIAASMKLFASAMADFGNLKWEQIAKGLTAIGVSLAEVTVAVRFMPKNMVSIGTGLVIVGGALEIIADVLGKLSIFSWEQIAKGLVAMGGAMAELAIGLKLMNGTLKGSAAMLVAAGALAVLAPVLKALGSMSWSAIAKGLTSIGGAFVIIGAAGLVLGPLTPVILGLGAAFALLGIGILGIGAGLLGIAAAFTVLSASSPVAATAVAASLAIIISGIAELIPTILSKIGEGIIELCKVITDGAPAVGDAFKSIVLTLVDVLTECVPSIADGALKLLTGVLKAIVEYTPQIVDSVLQFIVKVLEGVAKNLPSLIQAGVDVVMAYFTGVVDALRGIDVDVLLKGIVGVGLMSAIMLALSAVASLTPGAMLGVLGMGAVIAELALVLAAIGALAQIPGLNWLIGEGGKLLEGIGTAIGSFVGGIVGGFMSGVSSQFPQIGTDLSAFMVNVQPFIDGAKSIDSATMEGVKALAGTILILTAADILQGLTSWLTGGSSLADFATQLVPFGTAMKEFSFAVAGMDAGLVANAATAGKTLAEMAATLPNSGGVWGFFAGENDMSEFGAQLVPFGTAMKEFSFAVQGMDADAVVNAATAGKAMAEMATTLPNSGGVVGFFAGENDMADFGKQLVPFGTAMKEFSIAVIGLNADAVTNAAIAGKAMAEMATTLPNSGGVVEFFTGGNDIDTFGKRLVPFGKSMKQYADSISGIDTVAIENSANAGKAVAELEDSIPNSGGIVELFAGDNTIDEFGKRLISFGENFAEYSKKMEKVKPNVLDATTNAASSIVELQKKLPKEGGWFSDDTTLKEFGQDMAYFGGYFEAFYGYIKNVNAKQLSGTVTEFDHLVSVFKKLDGMEMNADVFASQLKNIAKSGINDFINAFTDATTKVKDTATKMLNTFISGVKSKQNDLNKTFQEILTTLKNCIKNEFPSFCTEGANLVKRFADGVKTNGVILPSSTVAPILQSMLNVVKNGYSDFSNSGQSLISMFTSGISTQSTNILGVFHTPLTNSIEMIKQQHGNFNRVGSYLVEGFVGGIKDNIYKAAAKAAEMGAAAIEAAKKVLDEHSPSKVFYGIAAYAGEGFVNALSDYTSKSYEAGSNIADSARNGLHKAVSQITDMIDSKVDTDPVIRPVLDLSNVQNGIHQLYQLTGGMDNYMLSGSVQLARETMCGMEDSRKSGFEHSEGLNLTKLDGAIRKLAERPVEKVENAFYITGNNSKEIAEEVSRIIQHQIERKDASWA